MEGEGEVGTPSQRRTKEGGNISGMPPLPRTRERKQKKSMDRSSHGAQMKKALSLLENVIKRKAFRLFSGKGAVKKLSSASRGECTPPKNEQHEELKEARTEGSAKSGVGSERSRPRKKGTKVKKKKKAQHNSLFNMDKESFQRIALTVSKLKENHLVGA